jgi:hypothetical protein
MFLAKLFFETYENRNLWMSLAEWWFWVIKDSKFENILSETFVLMPEEAQLCECMKRNFCFGVQKLEQHVKPQCFGRFGASPDRGHKNCIKPGFEGSTFCFKFCFFRKSCLEGFSGPERLGLILAENILSEIEMLGHEQFKIYECL